MRVFVCTGSQYSVMESSNAMKNSLRLLAVVAIAAAMLFAAGCNKLRAGDELNKGVQSYKNSKYEEAIDHFQQAVSLDPGLLNARLYLATAFAQQYIPGADTPDNNKMAEQAIDQYKEVLKRDPKNINSVKGIAYLYIQDGITALNKALQLRPDYDDAMAYMNLLYREKADLECTDPAARAADLKTADDWVDKTMAIKKLKAEKQPGAQGVTLDQSK